MADEEMTVAEQERILAEIARDTSAPPSARVTALRTLHEMSEERSPELEALPGGLEAISPSRYRKRGLGPEPGSGLLGRPE
jgi:hypothetical protein